MTMSDSLKQSPDSLKKGSKADPFAVADLDSLADQMLLLLKEPSLDRDTMTGVAVKIKEAANSATLFIIEAGLAE